MRNLKTVHSLPSDCPPKCRERSPLSQAVNFTGNQRLATTRVVHDKVTPSIKFFPELVQVATMPLVGDLMLISHSGSSTLIIKQVHVKHN